MKGQSNTAPSDQANGAARVAIAVGYGVSLVPLVLAFTNDNYLAWWRPLPHAIGAAVLLATPSTIALLGLLRRRPGMLLIAGVLGLFGILGFVSVLGYPLVVLGVIWIASFSRTGEERYLSLMAGVAIAPVLWIGASFALWIHLDPVCEQLMRDGTVVTIDAAERGFESGWTWQVDTRGETSSGPIGQDVASQHCASDTVTPIEALALITLCAGTVLLSVSASRPRKTSSL